MRVDAPEPDDVAGESSADVAARVLVALRAPTGALRRLAVVTERVRRRRRGPRLLPLGADADDVWRDLIDDRQLTGRGATRIRRVARTLADLDDGAGITADHLETRRRLRGDVP